MARPPKPRMDLEGTRSRVTGALRWRQSEGYDALWERMSDLYQGKHFEGMSREDKIAVNLAFQTANTIYASTTVNYPKIKLYARDPDKNDQAIVAQAVLDYLWKSQEINASAALRRAVKDSVITGLGIIKTGWRYSERPQARTADAVQADASELIAQADEFAAANPELAAELPTDEDILAGIPATEVAVGEDRVFVERVSPKHFVVDPYATSPDDMGWCAQRTIVPLDQVRRDTRYDSKARRSVKADSIGIPDDLDARSESDNTAMAGTEPDRVSVWEFYDLRLGMVGVFASTGDGWLVKPQPIPYRVGHPFVFLPAYEVPDRFYPMGDLEAIEPLQHELNRTRSQIVNARKNYARKYLVNEKHLTPQVRSALVSATDGEVVPIQLDPNTGETLASVIAPAPIHQLPADLYQHSDVIGNDIFQVSGVSEYQRGGGGAIRRTATEAAMIQDATNARAADRLGSVERAIAGVGRNMLYLQAQYMTGEQVARIVGRNGLPVWVSYDQWTIDVEADFEVEGGSTTPKNEGWQQNQAMQLAQAIGPFVGSVVDPAAFATYMLRAFGINDAERFLMAPDPMMAGMGGPEGDMGPALPPGAALPPELADQAVAPAEVPTGDAEGMGAPPQIPPELLAQLAGQVGLGLGA